METLGGNDSNLLLHDHEKYKELYELATIFVIDELDESRFKAKSEEEKELFHLLYMKAKAQQMGLVEDEDPEVKLAS